MSLSFPNISSIFSRTANLVVNRTSLVLKISLLLMAISIFGMISISMATGNDTYQDKDSESSVISNHFSDTFSQESIIILVECGDLPAQKC